MLDLLEEVFFFFLDTESHYVPQVGFKLSSILLLEPLYY
jgi:hypothetical protein